MLETKFNHPQKALFVRRVMNSSPESSQASVEAIASDRSPLTDVPGMIFFFTFVKVTYDSVTITVFRSLIV